MPRLYRFYLDLKNSANQLDLDTGIISVEDADILHQLTKVLRMSESSKESVSFFDASGMVYETKIQSLEGTARIVKKAIFKLINQKQSERELELKTRFFVPIIKLEMLELMVQKLTELGVCELVPVNFERSQKQNLEKINNSKAFRRLEKIAIEAVEQCEGGVLPLIKKTIDFSQVKDCISKYDLNIYASERLAGASANNLEKIKTDIQNAKGYLNLLVGPEGGLSEDENKVMQGIGFLPISLGRRLLKAETAAISLFSMFDLR